MHSILVRPSPAPDRTVPYGDAPEQVYDVRSPDAPVGATVVVVHGGFWRPEYDRAHAGNQSAALAAHGFHVATIEYRRPEDGRWPVLSADVRAALQAVRCDPELPERIVLVGHSAGGQVVTWLLHQPEGQGVAAAVALAGCVDLHVTHDLNLGDGAAAALMDGPPQSDPGAWNAADPARLGPPSAPVVLVHGQADDVVPQSVAESYADRMASLGTPVRLESIPGCGHYELIDPQSDAFHLVVEVVRSLIQPR